MNENTRMEIWDQVSKTDPKHTKSVNQRGGFTSIDAMYQVQRATEVFGPCGIGWGYEAGYVETVLPDGQVLANADVTLWYRLEKGGAQASYGPVRGCNVLQSANGRIDDDAWKKAMTDALTKALSHLGFSADVFLGRYDDNKYVAGLKKEFEEKEVAVWVDSEALDAILFALENDDPESLRELTRNMERTTLAAYAKAMNESQRDLLRNFLRANR